MPYSVKLRVGLTYLALNSIRHAPSSAKRQMRLPRRISGGCCLPFLIRTLAWPELPVQPVRLNRQIPHPARSCNTAAARPKGSVHVTKPGFRNVRRRPAIRRPAAGGRGPREGRHAAGIVLGAGCARHGRQQAGAGADAGGRSRRRWHRDRAVQWRQTHQERRRIRQCGDDLCRRQVGHVPHADPPGHRDPAGCARGGGNYACSGAAIPHRGRSRVRGDGAHGRRVHSDGDVARLPRRPGVRHLRRGRRRGEDPEPRRRCRSTAPSPSASTWRLATWKVRAAAGVPCARAVPCAMRCSRWRWRSTARRAARRHWKATPASIMPTPATISANCATASPATTAPI